MGLDQYAFARKGEEEIELMYWRKHANLQGWMENLYRKRGGDHLFNCIDLKLTSEDLVRLDKEHRNLEKASGFFWGETSEAKIERTQEFIDNAFVKLTEGYEIIYSSWW